MQTQKYSVNQHHISTFLAFVRDGQIAIPEVQRPFVWDSSKVRDLLDSLYKGYPIGYVILFNKKETVFGTMNNNGTNLKITTRVDRDLIFDDKSTVRIVFKRDMMEAYVNDYLVMLKRMKWTGKAGVVERVKNLEHIKGWMHE
jgi:hypothetical protein